MFAGGSMLICRLLLFPFFISLLWVADFNFPILLKKIILFLAVSITITYSGIYTFKYKEINKQISEYVSCVGMISPNSVVLNISGNQRAKKPDGSFISDKVASFVNIGGRISYYKPVVDLSNYMAWSDYGILDFRSEYNPNEFLHEAGKNYFTGSKNILKYPQVSRGRIDYVILWNYKYYDENYNAIKGKVLRKGLNPDQETIKDVRNQLDLGFDLIYISQTGLLELYRKIP